jgi:DNA-binding transcriptional LysR family regulator
MTLNLHLLRIFAAVAELGSFSRAATTLYISQPAVSKAVAELERQLGIALIDRSSRAVRLTEAGALLCSYAQQLFATERAAEKALAQLQGLEAGSLAVGASSTIGIYLLLPLIGEFHRRYPQLRLFLDIGNTQQIVERLRSSPLDIAFVEGPVEVPDLLIEPWREDTLVVIAPPDHPLAHGGPVALEWLLEDPFVLRELGSGTREVIEATLRARGRLLRVEMELGSTEAIKRAVRAGLGLAIVSVVTIEIELAIGHLVVLDVPDLVMRRQLTRLSVVGRPPSPALMAFQTLLDTQQMSTLI